MTSKVCRFEASSASEDNRQHRIAKATLYSPDLSAMDRLDQILSQQESEEDQTEAAEAAAAAEVEDGRRAPRRTAAPVSYGAGSSKRRSDRRTTRKPAMDRLDQILSQQESEEDQTEAAAEAVYKIASLIGKRLPSKEHNQLCFLVRWEGYGPEADSWEPSGNLPDDLVREYEDRNDRVMKQSRKGPSKNAESLSTNVKKKITAAHELKGRPAPGAKLMHAPQAGNMNVGDLASKWKPSKSKPRSSGLSRMKQSRSARRDKGDYAEVHSAGAYSEDTNAISPEEIKWKEARLTVMLAEPVSPTARPQSVVPRSGQQLKIKHILGRKVTSGVRQYLVSYIGRGEDANEWLPDSRVSASKADSFERRDTNKVYDWDNDESVYSADRVSNSRINESSRCREYLVHWSGYANALPTWVKEGPVSHDLIEKYRKASAKSQPSSKFVARSNYYRDSDDAGPTQKEIQSNMQLQASELLVAGSLLHHRISRLMYPNEGRVGLRKHGVLGAFTQPHKGECRGADVDNLSGVYTIFWEDKTAETVQFPNKAFIIRLDPGLK